MDIETIYFPEEGPKKEWKICQEMYHRLVQDHTDAGHKHKRVINDEKVDNAMFYITQKADYGIYPAKSRMVAIIYATMINQVYGDDFYATLDDPDLLYGQDDFFVPYSEDRKTYDAIIDILRGFPNWMEGGWAPMTVGYFHMECTVAGIEKITNMLCE